MFTIQRAIHTIKGDNSKRLFLELCPFFDFYPLSSTPRRALAHAYGALDFFFKLKRHFNSAEPHSSVGSVYAWRTGGRFPRLGQYSFRGLMIVIVTGFISLSPMSIVSTMVMWESSYWLGKNIVQSTG